MTKVENLCIYSKKIAKTTQYNKQIEKSWFMIKLQNTQCSNVLCFQAWLDVAPSCQLIPTIKMNFYNLISLVLRDFERGATPYEK